MLAIKDMKMPSCCRKVLFCRNGKEALEKLGEIEDIVNSWEKTNNADDTIDHFYAIREVIKRT